ncbi:DUF3000 domain-containing protein [Lipingzhangella sp. LS1_29]|uniref:DUF3000 domain-containing protein n=1 Tax=Lipingzhangella rawalii TaxID=2055835 RepID=A0ABU2H1X1_9ACTN|nr:DUF3000 domain-containing protein [Lipingzhangella rawalii]MDS1268860.1 DUF3000 domain-containing protein [Lipingzhangella rawalii]
MPPPGKAEDVPAEFQQALASLEAPQLRPEVRIEEIPAPRRLAPHAAAWSGAVHVDGDDVALGRLIVLYDPDQSREWPGPLRIVAYVGAELESEMAADPLVGEVTWSWLTEGLSTHTDGQQALSGTVTRATTEGFGTKADQSTSTEVELRASWTPVSVELSGHMAAWLEVMCAIAGLPPMDVSDLDQRRSRA